LAIIPNDWKYRILFDGPDASQFVFKYAKAQTATVDNTQNCRSRQTSFAAGAERHAPISITSTETQIKEIDYLMRI
jgi:hypothetical protein